MPLFSQSYYRRFIFLIIATCFLACQSKQKINDADPSFGRYIDGFTSGVVSKAAVIRIRLSEQTPATHVLNEVIKEPLFSFSPAVKGKGYWTDARTIEFRPDEYLKPGQLYSVNFFLGKVAEVPEAYKKFHFNVQALEPGFQVIENGLKVPGNAKEVMELTGRVETADVESSAAVEKLLTVSYPGQMLAIQWEHNEVARTHAYSITDIKRNATTSVLQLLWDGAPLGIKEKGSKAKEVPAKGVFTVMEIRAVQDVESYVLAQFSEPIATAQQLKGLFTLSDKTDLSYNINGSEVKLYVPDDFDGNYTATVNEGIQSIWNTRLNKSFTANLYFENRLPSVTIRGRGMILPSSGKLIMPFEAINLNAVDISIIKIFKNNIPQFFQSNEYDGAYDLRRVAAPVVQQTLRLDNDKTIDLHRRQHFSLDIDKYLKAEPGVIYNITIGFRPEYSLYTCRSRDEVSEEEDRYYSRGEGESLDSDEDFWKGYNTYYPYGYNWKERNNPCHPSYYNKEKWASRNILASNIGLSVKRGNDNSMLVAATNILSAMPMGEVELEFLDYQQQILFHTKTDRNGLAVFDLKRKPFLLVAKKGQERGYLKLEDGGSLMLSRFDVSGVEVKQGLKGFIFGERGVWRPGDTMYISCIVEDRSGRLPKDHPVEFNLINPQGQLYKRIVETSAENGFYLFAPATEVISPTGNWLARVKVGGAVFEKRLKVETVMPNRLKIDLDFGNAPILSDEDASGTLRSQWLFGTPARNLAAKVDASFYARKTVFRKYPGYHFDNPTAAYTTEMKTLFDGRLNEHGEATVPLKLGGIKNAPGVLNANILVKVFEPGGAFSLDSRVIPYSPFKSYVGLQIPEGQKPWGFLLTDKQYELSVVNVDKNGNPLSGSQQVEIELYRVSWRWWWDDTGDGFSNFTQDKYNKLLKKDTVLLTNGVGKWQFSAPKGDWGRYLILVRDRNSGHTAGQVVFFDDPWWQSRKDNTDPSAAAMLSFTSSKEKYNVGENISLQIPGSKGGRALISIESGSRVIKTDWVDMQDGQTIYTFKAEPTMTPNIYVNVSLLQPHAQTINDLPIRMYGVIPVIIEDQSTVLKPVIAIPSEIRPEQKASVTVSETSGKAMTYSVAIVDEGLLDLTRFKTPDPHAAFFAREALGVKSWDLFDQVIGAWGGGLERILTIGGDEAAAGAAAQKGANRFKPVVKYMGPFHLKKGQKQTHDFQLPSYIGSVRAMVVAAGDKSYGFAEKSVTVKKPLMILGTLPRVLAPEETIRLPVTVFAMDKAIRKVAVTIQNNAYLAVTGDAINHADFSAPGEKIVYFDLKVKENTGMGKIKLTAVSGNENAEEEMEIDVRNPNPAVTRVEEGVLAGGEQFKTILKPLGIPAKGKATLEISVIPPIDLEKRLSYLIQFPHGCIEQITSAVFPQLVLGQILDLNERQKAEAERNVRAGIERYANFQRPDGGFSYWPGLSESDEWGTSYAGHFLLEAQRRGYLVSAELLQQWQTYQRRKANTWMPSSSNFYGGDLNQAYRLYLLASAKAPELGAMNRLREFKYLSPEAKWRLAAAYHLAGYPKVATEMVAGLSLTFPRRPSAGITYGSGLRDEAMVLETLTLMNNRKEALQALRNVSAQMAGDHWYSTQTTAYSLIAIAAYCGANDSGERIMAKATINGKNVNVNTSSYVIQVAVSTADVNRNVVLANKGENILYVRLISEGQLLTGEEITIKNNADVLSMRVDYMSLEGNPLNIATLQQGTDFVARVKIGNSGIRGRYNNMTLSQVFPGGWEILNTRMLDIESQYKSSPFTYMDIRDDRVYTHFDIREGETKEYYVLLNAAYAGRYFLPGAYCEAMYDNTISVGVKGMWVEVR